MSGPSTSKGFTLIELMIIVAILAIFATIAVPSFTSFIAANRVQSAASELQSLLQMARSEAVTQRRQISLCDRGSGHWEVRREAGCGSDDDDLLSEMDLPSGVASDSSASRVTFAPSGTASDWHADISGNTDRAYRINVGAPGYTRMSAISAPASETEE